MKKHLLACSIALLCLTVFSSMAIAQAPGSFNYQGVARSATGSPLANKSIAIQASILLKSATGTAIYTESQTVTTTAQGYFTILIGTGTVSYGVFNQINWADTSSKWLQISIDPAGGTNFTLMGASQLVSVPFALYAAHAPATKINALAPLSVSADNDIAITPGTTVGDLISWDGVNWVAKQPVSTQLPDTTITINNLQPYVTLNYCMALEGIFPSRNGEDPFLGEIELYGFNFPPRGWAACDGSLLSIQTNVALFSLIGTYYGGDGIRTFALPDLRGRVPVGVNGTTYQIGQIGGAESNTITIHR